MALTAQRISQIHNEMAAALDAIAEKHGLKRAPSRVVYDNSYFKFTCQFGDKEEIGTIDPKFVRTLDRNGFMYGFTREMIDTEIKVKEKTYAFVGMIGTNKVVLRDKANGKLVSYPAELISTIIKQR